MSAEGGVKVAVRFRPPLSMEREQYAWDLNKADGIVIDRSGAENDSRNNTVKSTYKFDQLITPRMNNDDVYTRVVSGVVDNWLAGYNGTIFAYGQTASGKTHTMFGHQGSEVGVVHRVLATLFHYIESHSESVFVVTSSFCEIYNEKACDLLSTDNITLPVRESNGTFYLDGLSEFPVSSQQEALDILATGNANKTLGKSYLNDMSSRSHTIFKLSLACSNTDGTTTVSELNLVDLAGAEMLVCSFGAAQQQETKNVNLSLFMLKSVISALANKDAFVPYRRSVVTKLLQNALGGNSLTAMICCVTPALRHEGMTRRSLAFGQVAKRVVNKVKRNVFRMEGSSGKAVKLRKQVEETTIDTRAVDGAKSKKKKKGQRRGESNLDMLTQEQIPLPDSFGRNMFVNCHTCGPDDGQIALVLHGFGPGGSGTNWKYILQPLAEAGYKVVAPDFPGFGESPGERQSSRTEKHGDPNGTVAVVKTILKHYQVSSREPAVALGYDWGAGIALSASKLLGRAIQRVVAFHPSWTADMALLNQIKTQTLMLWVPVEQLHPITGGKRMVRALPNATMVKLDCGPFSRDKPKGTYACISEHVIKTILNWLPTPKRSASRAIASDDDDDDGGGAGSSSTAPAMISADELRTLLKNPASRQLASGSRTQPHKSADDKLRAMRASYTTGEDPPEDATPAEVQHWAVSRFRELRFSGELDDYYKAYQTSTPMKPKVVRLWSLLPDITPTTTVEEMHACGLWPKLPQGLELLHRYPRYLPGRQVLVVAPVHGEVDAGAKDGHEDFGCFKKNGKYKQLSHRARIVAWYEEDRTFSVALDGRHGEEESVIRVPARDVFKLNEPTNFDGDAMKSGLLFEDGVRCKYSDLLTKAKLVEAAIAVAPIIGAMNFETDFEETPSGRVHGQGDGARKLLAQQREILVRVRKSFDCIHFDYEPMVAARSSRPEVGQLALYGQGNCHTMASVMAAMLIPFGNMIGVEVRYRAGSCIKTKRDLDPDTLECLDGWDRRPRNIDDHTWLEVTMIPSLQSFVCDPSSHELCIPLDHAYSRWGRRHPSTKRQCNSNPVLDPETVYKDGVSVAPVERLFWKKGDELRQPKPSPIVWKNIGKEWAKF